MFACLVTDAVWIRAVKSRVTKIAELVGESLCVAWELGLIGSPSLPIQVGAVLGRPVAVAARVSQGSVSHGCGGDGRYHRD